MYRIGRISSSARLPEAGVLALAAALLCATVAAGYAVAKPAASNTASAARPFRFSVYAYTRQTTPALVTPLGSSYVHHPSLMLVVSLLAIVHVRLLPLTAAPPPITSAIATPDPPPPRFHR
jgi:hypothetical protein